MRADAFIIFPSIDTFESSHAATANSPLQRGWGYVSISSNFSPLFRGAGGMSLYPLLPLIPLPLFHTPGPFQKGRADAFIIFPPIDISESSHAATANSPLQRGWGYVSISSTPSSFFIPPAPFKRGGLTRPWHTHWQAPYPPTPPPRAPLFRGAGGMSLYSLLPLLFSYPRPLSKGEG